jgi:hypothetical protein
MQEEITPAELLEAHQLLTEFSDEYEALYYQRRSDRLHFVRPSIHTPSHMAPETARVGPSIIYSQWALERTIGNLGEEIKQHSNAFMNLAHRALRHCQINALKAMIPDLEPPENPFPHGSVDVGEGYVLLTATDTTSRPVNEAEGDAIKEYLLKSGQNYPEDWLPSVTRWSRVCLPNGQVARSAWKENIKPIEQLRCARNVKVGSLVHSLQSHSEIQIRLNVAENHGLLKCTSICSSRSVRYASLWQSFHSMGIIIESCTTRHPKAM